MKDTEIAYLLGKLGLKKVKTRSRWVTCECPFASRNHQGGSDEHPSFGVSVGDFPHYRCQACGEKGPLTGLVWYFARQYPNNAAYWSTVFQWVISRSNVLGSLKEPNGKRIEIVPGISLDDTDFTWGKSIDPDTRWLETFEPTILDDSILGDSPTVEALQYLKGKTRRLTDRTIEAWGIRFWPKKLRVVIPMRDYTGKLVGASGRTIVNAKPKFLHTTGFKRDYFLFGEHMLDETTTPRVGYVVEGHFDVIYLWQVGYRSPVGIMGTYPSRYQIMKIKKFFDKLVVIPDADKAGEPMPHRLAAALPDMEIKVAKLPQGQDLDELPVDELHAIIASATQIGS